MSTLRSLKVALGIDTAEFDQGVDKAIQKTEGISQKLGGIGKGLTAGVTLPLIGLGAGALKMSTDLNAGLANVASLGTEAAANVETWKPMVQEAAIAVGKGADDMVGGLYQVVSAIGTTSDTMDILEINAKTAAAGLSTTEEAIALTTAVTKGYGDTSKEAFEKASDLALMTVQLGQTTFPELASSMGKVVPLASSLGVSQEELFAQMATLTGVTGNAAEVSTQLRATYQSLIKPTTEMAGAIGTVAYQLDEQGQLASGPLVDSWRQTRNAWMNSYSELENLETQLTSTDRTTKEGAKTAQELEKAIKVQEGAVKEWGKAVDDSAAALGPSIVESVGLTNALGMLSDTAGGNTNQLGKMFGSVESLNAVLALSGPQADVFEGKLAAMGGAAGATDEAFAAQTEGINRNGFAMEQAKVKAEVFMQKLGDGLAPALSAVMNSAGPLLDKVLTLADGFANLDPTAQMVIVGFAAVAAGVGPLLIAIGMLLPALGAVGGALVAITWPIWVIIGVIALLALAWMTDFGGIRTSMEELWTGTLQPLFAALVAWLQQNIPVALQTLSDVWNNVLLPAITAVWSFLDTYIIPLLSALARLWLVIVQKAFEALVLILTDVVIPALTALWRWIDENVVPILKDLAKVTEETVGPILSWLGETVLTPLGELFGGVGQKVKDLTAWLGDLADKVANFDLGKLGDIAGEALSGVGSLFDGTRATGGPVFKGRSYLVGEGGEPELFTPNVDGQITPLSQLQGAGGVNVTFSGPINVRNREDAHVLGYQLGMQALRMGGARV